MNERKGPDAPMTSRVAQAVRELEQVARALLASEQHLAPEAKVEAVELPIMLSFHGADTAVAREFRVAESGKLVELLRGRVRDALLNAVAFQRGRVYCLRCESSLCSHSLPTGPRTVFAGYEETGRPDWIEFDKLLLRRRDARLERLFGDRGREVVAVALHRDELYGRLFEGFDAPKWRGYVLGQLCIGYFLPGESRDRRGETMALTVQLVRTEKPPEGALLGLNLIGRLPEPPGPPSSTAPAPLDETVLEGLPDALRHLRREISVFSGRGGTRVPGIGVALERLTNRCHHLMKQVARDLDHRTRMEGRRTGHANARSRQGDRPTHKAFEDARAARDDQCLFDIEHGTVAVLGPAGRVHFFSPAGKHVTSVVFPGQVVQQRVGQKRWAPLEPVKLAAFRQALAVAPAGGVG